MGLPESLRSTYTRNIDYYGGHFNRAPERDALGRRPATANEVLKAINGDHNLPQKVVFRREKPRRRKR